MNINEQITNLAEEIMVDITNNRLPLHNILLKASRLSLLLNMPENIKFFKEWAKYAEQNLFIVETFKSSIEATKDPDVSIASANPDQYIFNPTGNVFERRGLRDEAKNIINNLAHYRAETYNFVLGVYTKWQFGNISEGIFEKKRKKAEPILREIFPDINQRLNSIEQNIRSNNQEDWKNAIASCRTLLMDIADILNPAKTGEERKKYIDRLKDYISPLVESEDKKNLLLSFLEEMKTRLEYTVKITQGGAHQYRPLLNEAEDIVLYTYLIIADLMEIYSLKTKKS